MLTNFALASLPRASEEKFPLKTPFRLKKRYWNAFAERQKSIVETAWTSIQRTYFNWIYFIDGKQGDGTRFDTHFFSVFTKTIQFVYSYFLKSYKSLSLNLDLKMNDRGIKRWGFKLNNAQLIKEKSNMLESSEIRTTNYYYII